MFTRKNFHFLHLFEIILPSTQYPAKFFGMGSQYTVRRNESLKIRFAGKNIQGISI